MSFPNCMVDRIIPGTTPADVASLRERFGVDDAWPVVCEPFSQWVVEDRFPTGRPPWEDAGVQLVEDVTPYETMKLRLLNGSHQALAYFARLAGFEFVHEACQDPLWSRFLREYMDREVTPTLGPVPGVDLEDYKQTVLQRLRSAAVADPVARLCAPATLIPKYVLPVVRAGLASGGEVHRAAAVVASWARYAEGRDGSGRPLPFADPRVAPAGEDPLAFLDDRGVFGDLAAHERFVSAYRGALLSLRGHGARTTLAAVLEGAGPGG